MSSDLLMRAIYNVAVKYPNTPFLYDLAKEIERLTAQRETQDAEDHSEAMTDAFGDHGQG